MNNRSAFSRIRDLFAASLVLLALMACTVAFADTRESPALDSTTLRFEMPDGTVASMDIAECTDPPAEPGGDPKFCLCQGVAFRVAQIVADEWEDGIFHVDDARVVTGWKTDGPEELFVDKLGMEEDDEEAGFSYDPQARPGAEQYIEDAWYEVTILSQGRTLTLNATDKIYGEESSQDFLTYRREVKGGDPTHKAEMQALRGQAAARIKADPFAAGSFWMMETEPTLGCDSVVYENSFSYRNAGGEVVEVSVDDCTDPLPGGGTKFCLCQGVAFRVAQMMRNAWGDGVFHPDDVTILTSWNTDGPEEFFVDKLGVASGDLVVCGRGANGWLDEFLDSTPGKDLVLADSRYEITVKSTGERFLFCGTGRLYVGEFLTYRSEVKNGDDTHKAEMQALRNQVQTNLTDEPFVGMLQASEASSGSSGGGCSVSGFAPAAVLALVPMLLIRR